jgi:hypothetical protein
MREGAIAVAGRYQRILTPVFCFLNSVPLFSTSVASFKKRVQCPVRARAE